MTDTDRPREVCTSSVTSVIASLSESVPGNCPKTRRPASLQDCNDKGQLPYPRIHIKNGLLARILFTPHGQPCVREYPVPTLSRNEGLRQGGDGGQMLPDSCLCDAYVIGLSETGNTFSGCLGRLSHEFHYNSSSSNPPGGAVNASWRLRFDRAGRYTRTQQSA